MPKVIFKYDIKKDAWSWVLIAKHKNCWGLNWHSQVEHIPDGLLNKILKLSFKKAQVLVEEYIKNSPKKGYRGLIIKKETSALNNVWQKTEKKFFNILSDITQQPIYKNKFQCFLPPDLCVPITKKKVGL